MQGLDVTIAQCPSSSFSLLGKGDADFQVSLSWERVGVLAEIEMALYEGRKEVSYETYFLGEIKCLVAWATIDFYNLVKQICCFDPKIKGICFSRYELLLLEFLKYISIIIVCIIFMV